MREIIFNSFTTFSEDKVQTTRDPYCITSLCFAQRLQHLRCLKKAQKPVTGKVRITSKSNRLFLVVEKLAKASLETLKSNNQAIRA